MRISDWSSDVCSSDLAQAGGPPGNGSHENAAFSHSCRSAIGRSLDQPGTTKLSLRDVCATALVRSHGLDRCGTPRNGRGNRTWNECLSERHSRIALRSLRNRLSWLHRSAILGESQRHREIM